MICVFGETGTRPEIVLTEEPLPSSETKRLDPPAKAALKRKNSTPSRQTGGCKGLGTRHSSLNDVRDNGNGSAVKTKPASRKTPAKSTEALRASLLQADMTFSRSRTSDAILSRSKRWGNDSPKSDVKRRGNPNLSREPSLENLRPASENRRRSSDTRRPLSVNLRSFSQSPRPSTESGRPGRPKSADGRRKSVGKRSPEVKRRSAASPVPARRKLEAEYDSTIQRRNRVRKDLNDNNLMFSRSFSADTIIKGWLTVACH